MAGDKPAQMVAALSLVVGHKQAVAQAAVEAEQAPAGTQLVAVQDQAEVAEAERGVAFVPAPLLRRKQWLLQR